VSNSAGRGGCGVWEAYHGPYRRCGRGPATGLSNRETFVSQTRSSPCGTDGSIRHVVSEGDVSLSVVRRTARAKYRPDKWPVCGSEGGLEGPKHPPPCALTRTYMAQEGPTGETAARPGPLPGLAPAVSPSPAPRPLPVLGRPRGWGPAVSGKSPTRARGLRVAQWRPGLRPTETPCALAVPDLEHT